MELNERISLLTDTLDALETIAGNCGEIPAGFVLQYAPDLDDSVGGWCNSLGPQSIGTGFYRLRQESTLQVPLGPEDITVGRTLFKTKFGTALILATSSDGISYAAPCHDDDLAPEDKAVSLAPIQAAGRDAAEYAIKTATWRQMMKHAEYSSDGGNTWSPCHKDAN